MTVLLTKLGDIDTSMVGDSVVGGGVGFLVVLSFLGDFLWDLSLGSKFVPLSNEYIQTPIFSALKATRIIIKPAITMI